MADQAEEQVEEEPKKKSKLPMILGLVLALAGGGGGFFAVYSGMLLAPATEDSAKEDSKPAEPLEDVSGLTFVPVDPMVVGIGGLTSQNVLRFRAQLEIPAEYQADVESMLPRVVDVLNNYLRALELEDLQGSNALLRLRAQMLRRVQMVLGEGRVNDLLVMEFVLN